MDTFGVGTRIALPVSLPVELRQHLGDGLGGAGLGDHHVQRRARPAAVGLVIVVDQVLVVGVGMHRLDVAVGNAELIVDGLQGRHDGVGGARRRGECGPRAR
jgi:hypothetical protein